MVDDPKDPRNRAEHISKAFDAASRGDEKPKQDAAQQRTGAGSTMVKAHAPGMDLRPSGALRDGPDRQKHESDLQKDRDMAEEARKRDLEKSKDRDKER